MYYRVPGAESYSDDESSVCWDYAEVYSPFNDEEKPGDRCSVAVPFFPESTGGETSFDPDTPSTALGEGVTADSESDEDAPDEEEEYSTGEGSEWWGYVPLYTPLKGTEPWENASHVAVDWDSASELYCDPDRLPREKERPTRSEDASTDDGSLFGYLYGYSISGLGAAHAALARRLREDETRGRPRQQLSPRTALLTPLRKTPEAKALCSFHCQATRAGNRNTPPTEVLLQPSYVFLLPLRHCVFRNPNGEALRRHFRRPNPQPGGKGCPDDLF